jgi:UDP-glucuronate 4-epimerase
VTRGIQVFNIGAGKAIRLFEFVETLQKVMDCTATIIWRDEVKADVSGTFADIQKARNMLGYNPKV